MSMRTVFTAANGLSTIQKRIDNVANNLSNVNTVGYKSTRTDFKDMLYQDIYREGVWNPNNNLQMGSGVKINAVTRNWSQGKMLPGGTTDLAIDGQGFYAVRGPGGRTLYTRDGGFQVNFRGDLLTNQGEPVLDINGNDIRVDSSNMKVDTNGNVFNSDGTYVTRIAVYNCNNPRALEAVGNNFFDVTPNSGPMQLEDEGQYQIRQGYYESSNVDLGTEFTYLIRAQRSMTMVSRALQTGDEMDAKANQLRR